MNAKLLILKCLYTNHHNITLETAMLVAEAIAAPFIPSEGERINDSNILITTAVRLPRIVSFSLSVMFSKYATDPVAEFTN